MFWKNMPSRLHETTVKKHVFKNLHFACMKRHVLAWHFRCGHKVLLGDETFKWISLLNCHLAGFPVYVFFSVWWDLEIIFGCSGGRAQTWKKNRCCFHCKNCAFGEHLSKRSILLRQNTSSPTYDDTCLPELCFGNTTSEGIPYCFRAGLVWVFWVIYARRLHPASGSIEIVSLRVKLWHFVRLFRVFSI